MRKSAWPPRLLSNRNVLRRQRPAELRLPPGSNCHLTDHPEANGSNKMSNLHLKLPLISALFLGAAWQASADTIPPQPIDGRIKWVYNYAEGQRLARASGKPMFVVFRCER